MDQHYDTQLYQIALPSYLKPELESSLIFTKSNVIEIDYTEDGALKRVFDDIPLPSAQFYHHISQSLAIPSQLLQNGSTIAFPTETVYGLGANACDTDAVSRIYEAKGRPSDNPLIVHIATLPQLLNLTPSPLSPLATALIHHFWPGPLSIILPHNSSVSSKVTAGLSTLAIRMPNHPIALGLISQSDRPIAAPSSNLSGRPSPTTAQHVMTDLVGRIPGVVDGIVSLYEADEKNDSESSPSTPPPPIITDSVDLNCKFGLESTVVDISHLPADYDFKSLFARARSEKAQKVQKAQQLAFSDETTSQPSLPTESGPKQPLIYILRPGAVTKAMLEEIVGVGYVEYDPSLLINMDSFDDIDNNNDLDTFDENMTTDNHNGGPKHTQFDTKCHGLQPKSPGMKYTHYAPKAPVFIATNLDVLTSQIVVALQNLRHKNDQNENEKNPDDNQIGQNTTETTPPSTIPSKIGLLCTAETSDHIISTITAMITSSPTLGIDLNNLIIKTCGSKDNMWSVATKLYGCLRDFDQIDTVSVIYAEIYSHTELGAAIMDRLLKAAGGKLLR